MLVSRPYCQMRLLNCFYMNWFKKMNQRGKVSELQIETKCCTKTTYQTEKCHRVRNFYPHLKFAVSNLVQKVGPESCHSVG